MIALDISSVNFTLGLVEVAVGLLLFGGWRAPRDFTFSQHWALSAICLGIGLLTQAFRGQILAGPWVGISIIAANFLIYTFVIFLHYGTARFLGLRAGYGVWYTLLSFIFLAAFFYFTFVDINVRGRIAVLSVLAIPLLAHTAYLFFTRGEGATERLLLWLIVSLFVSVSVRGGAALLDTQTTNYLYASNIYSLTVLVALFNVLIVATQFRLIGERSLGELAEQNRSLVLREANLEHAVEDRTRELTVLNNKLAALSITDSLTGIANRRRFDEVLRSEWSRAARSGQPLALALLDVDMFKKYNDHYGHQAGDDCLRTVATVFATNVRRTCDLVARYGGEEFAFIAPATNEAHALGLAEAVCKAMEDRGLPHFMSPFGVVTVSIGVAVIVPDEGVNVEMLVKKADTALYHAKQCGRNRAVLAGEMVAGQGGSVALTEKI